ncbi:MAG: class I SAM-dependent methyltransferase [Acidobacteriota bacterium]
MDVVKSKEQNKCMPVFAKPANVETGPTKWEDVWDHIWQTGASGCFISAGREAYNVLLRKLLMRHLSLKSRLLELGCGTSTLTLSLAPHIKELVGLDISAKGLDIARQNQEKWKISNATFVKADCRNVPFVGEFDVVWSAGLIEHFFDEDINIVREHLKALKPGGVALMSVPYAYSLHSLHYLLTRPAVTRRFWPWSQERYFQRFYSHRDLHVLGKCLGSLFKVYLLPPAPLGLLLGIIILEVQPTDRS